MSGKRRLLLVLLVLTVCFIWGHSLMSGETSKAESGSVLDFLTPLLELLVGRGNATDHLVRKLAHFAEYSLLGLELALWFRGSLAEAETAFLHGFGIAFLDESLQLLSSRGSQISDVWLDMAGVLAGIGFVHLLRKVMKKETE